MDPSALVGSRVRKWFGSASAGGWFGGTVTKFDRKYRW
jgi:hypothetical protein